MVNSVLIVLEQENGKITSIGKELLCEGAKLASILKTDLEAVAVGYGLDSVMEELGEFDCKRIYYIEDKRLAEFRSLTFAKSVLTVIKKYNPQIVLFGATAIGRDIAPRIASALKCGLTADCTALKIGDFKLREETYHNKLLQIRPAFGGNIIATIVSPESFPSMATVRKGVLKMTPLKKGQKVEVVKEKVLFEKSDFITEIAEVLHREKEVDLQSAQIIVSAGMGAEKAETLAHIRELADLFGGVVGASRAYVDAGLLSKDHQVGQTGTTVRPALYIACGISGQIQHRAGMSESKRIIAINNDPEAPIFGIAHYGIVGDLEEVLPMMIKAYRQKV